MKSHQIAAQLYTVRDYCKTASDFAQSMQKLRAIGYQSVQISGVGPIPEDELMRVLDGEGLTCCATHEPVTTILENPQAVVERLGKLRCTYTAVPHPGTYPMGTLAEVKDFAAKMDRAGAVLAGAGQVLTYHNHHLEFRKVEGRLLLDWYYHLTSPDNLQGELDTYWVQYGGGDPVDWCLRLHDRLPLLHLKDYRINANNEPEFAEVGEGTLNWPVLLPAAETSGCRWFIVEQDTTPGDPFDALAQSFHNLQSYCLPA